MGSDDDEHHVAAMMQHEHADADREERVAIIYARHGERELEV